MRTFRGPRRLGNLCCRGFGNLCFRTIKVVSCLLSPSSVGDILGLALVSPDAAALRPLAYFAPVGLAVDPRAMCVPAL